MTDMNNTSSLLAAMEDNYNAYAIYFSRLPYLELQQSPTMMFVMSREISFWNVVLRTRLTQYNVTATIEAMLARFEALNVPLTWHILPSTQPADLAWHLEEYNFVLFDEEPHMVIEPATLSLHAPNVAGFTIERVTDAGSFARWYEVAVAGFFASTPSTGQVLFDAYTLLGFDPQGPFLHYVGYMKGVPVTSSTLLLAGGIAGIYDVSTIPLARGKGFGTAITLDSLREAQRLGYRYVCLQATKMGYPIYERIGFKVQFHEHKYLWRPDSIE